MYVSQTTTGYTHALCNTVIIAPDAYLGASGERICKSCCRNDAGLAAAELALAVEKATLDTGAIDAVGTTGFVQLGPNAMNSVPRDAKLEIDIRDIDAARRDATVKSVLKAGIQRCLCLISGSNQEIGCCQVLPTEPLGLQQISPATVILFVAKVNSGLHHK